MSKKQQAQSSKRQFIREERAKKQRQQRMIVIAGIALVAVALVAIIAVPSFLRNNAPVGDVIQITPKALPQAEGTTLGDPNAPVKIVVFSDFQCPACKSFSEQVEPQIIENLVKTGRVSYTYRQFPFLDDRSATKESDQAANASQCANEQGRFWDYHNMLFANWNRENEGAFANRRLVAFAEALGLNMTQFNACFESNKYEDQINKDLADGRAQGVTGTPSVFVNGKIILPGYVPNYDQILEEVTAAGG